MKTLARAITEKIRVNGYAPFCFFNIFLSLATVILVALGGLGIGNSIEENGFGAGLKMAFSSSGYYKYTGFLFVIGLACFVFLIIRNLKMQSVPKIIIFTILQLIISAVVGFVLLILFMLAGTFSSGGSTSSVQNETPTNTQNKKNNTGSAYDYTSGQDELARSYGFTDSEQAKLHGIDTKTML